MPAVVVDANVFFQALFYEDAYAQALLSHIRKGTVVLLMSDDIEEELLVAFVVHVLKVRLSPSQAAPAMKKLFRLIRRAQRVEPPRVFTECEDKHDNKFFDCAIAGKADYIITADSHVNGVANPPVPVLAPWQFFDKVTLVSSKR